MTKSLGTILDGECRPGGRGAGTARRNRPVLAGLAVSILAPMCVLAQTPADSQPSVPAATQALGVQTPAAARTPAGTQSPVPVHAAGVAPAPAATQAPGAQTPAGSQPPIPVRVADAAPVLAAAQAPAVAQTPAPAARGPSLKLALEAAQKAVDT